MTSHVLFWGSFIVFLWIGVRCLSSGEIDRNKKATTKHDPCTTCTKIIRSSSFIPFQNIGILSPLFNEFLFSRNSSKNLEECSQEKSSEPCVLCPENCKRWEFSTYWSTRFFPVLTMASFFFELGIYSNDIPNFTCTLNKTID